MPKRTFPESILAIFAGRERAAALYGDLLEMSATRGRTWLWSTYAATLARLLGRPAVAFALGYLVYVAANFTMARPWIGPGAGSHPYAVLQHLTQPVWLIIPYAVRGEVFTASHAVSACFAITLWFAFPYVVVRYGWRDRLAQLSSLIFLASLVASIDPPALEMLFFLVVITTVLGGLLLREWRRPVAILVATVISGVAAIAGSFFASALATMYLQEQFEPSRLHEHLLLPWKIISLFSLIAPAVVCSRLHRWLLGGERNVAHAETA